jgi:uncharacterized membrane protein YhdT
MELCNAYTELGDPMKQRQKFMEYEEVPFLGIIFLVLCFILIKVFFFDIKIKIGSSKDAISSGL